MEAAGLITPMFRPAAGGATMEWLIAPIGGLIAAQKSKQ